MKSRWRWLILMLLATVVAGFVGYRIAVRQILNNQLEAIRRAGEPVTLAELSARLPNPSPAENAAELYRQAFAQSVVITCDDPLSELLPVEGAAKPPPKGEPLTAEMRAVIESYLAQNESALRLFHAGAGLSSCRYQWEYSLCDLPGYFAPLRRGLRLLLLEVLWHADRGDAEGATEALWALAALTRSRRIPTSCSSREWCGLPASES